MSMSTMAPAHVPVVESAFLELPSVEFRNPPRNRQQHPGMLARSQSVSLETFGVAQILRIVEKAVW